MANRIRIVEEAQRRVRRQTQELAADLREARLAAGLRQHDVAKVLGWSHSRVGRIERGNSRRVSLSDLGSVAACVGLSLSVRLFPASGRLRDAAQVGMINRYLDLVKPGQWTARIEAPVGIPGDLRAFDLMLTRAQIRVAHEFISRLRDVRAQARRLTTKQADAGETRLVLVIAATHANRRAVAEAGMALRASFPHSTRTVLAALRAGADPGGNGIVFL